MGQIASTWARLDRTADKRLGFVSASTIGAVTGGGIPAWLLSRLVILAVVAGSTWWVVDSYNDRIRAARDVEWQAKLTRQMDAVRAEQAAKARETQEKIEASTAKWDDAIKRMLDYTDELEKSLADEKSKPRVLPECPEYTIPPKALKALRNKARALK